MTTKVARLTPRGAEPSLPHLPPVARDPVDDAREVIDRLKSAGDDANIAAAEMTRLLEQLAAMAVRPRRTQLAPWLRLSVEQARMFADQLALAPRASDVDCGRLIGRLEVHLGRLLDVIDTVCEPY